MDRELDPDWIQGRDDVEALLEPLGFRLDDEQLAYGAFGSVLAEYRGRNMVVHLAWDGKDRWLWATVTPVVPGQPIRRQARAVDQPSTNPRASVLRPGPLTDEYIGNVVRAMRNALVDAGAAYPGG